MNDSVDLIKIFIQNQGSFVSGADLAERFQITRVGIRKRIEALQNQGFKFKAVRNRGYLLEAFPDKLNGDLITAHSDLKPHPPKILFFESIDSTNSEAERQLASGESKPIFIVSASQDSGRGRRGRSWHSPSGNNAYITAAFRPLVPVQRMQLITLWLGFNICRFISKRLQAPIKIKWPNDLIFENRKVAGMLTEARVDSDMMRELVFGIGININGSIQDFPEELKSFASTLETANEFPIPINEFVSDLISVIKGAYEKLIDHDISEELINEWNEYDFLFQKSVNTDQGSGTAEGINKNGSLKIRKEDGSLLLLHAGDVTLGSSTTLTN